MKIKNRSSFAIAAVIAFGAISGLWISVSSLKKAKAQNSAASSGVSGATGSTAPSGTTGSSAASGVTGSTAVTGATATSGPASVPDAGVTQEPTTTKTASLNMSGDQYVYDPAGRRDPFRPFKSVLAQVENKGSHSDNSQPLERYDLGDLKVIGVIWGTKRPRAVVKDKNNESFIVYRGTRMGKKEGVVSEIRESGITVIEVEYGEGTIAKVPRVMTVSK